MSEKVKKVSEEHLSKLQELNQNFANLHKQVGDLEVRKHQVLSAIDVLRSEFKSFEAELIKSPSSIIRSISVGKELRISFTLFFGDSPVLLTLVVVIGVSHEFDIKLQNGWFGILMPSVLLGPIIFS